MMKKVVLKHALSDGESKKAKNSTLQPVDEFYVFFFYMTNCQFINGFFIGSAGTFELLGIPPGLCNRFS